MIRKMKKQLIMGIVLVSLTSILYYIIYINTYLNIKIINNTSSTISGLKITSNLLRKNIKVNDIEPKKDEEIKINSSKEFMDGEGALYLKSEMKSGQVEEFYLVEYMEGGTTGNIEVTIEEDKNGKIYTSVEEKRGIHNILNY